MLARLSTAAATGWLLFACTPAAARPPATPTPAVASAPAPTPAPSDGADAPVPPPEGGFSCVVQVEIRDETRARGTASSDADPEQARAEAWRLACDDLRASTGLDCEDESRVRVVKRSSSTRMSPDGTAHYEQTYELTSFREASGTGDSPESRAAACEAATARACASVLDGPCPEGRVTVLRTDQSQHAPAPRPTI